MLRSRFPTFETSCPSLTGGFPLGFANGVLSFADGNVEYLLSKLDGIARTFGHESEYATDQRLF
jgi:hypothetical protein